MKKRDINLSSEWVIFAARKMEGRISSLFLPPDVTEHKTGDIKRPTIKNYKKYGLHISPSPLRGEAGWG